MSNKRTDYITWDEYFMGVAMLAAKRSKDPSTQVGACIVSEDNKILSMGYNGFPKGCSDDEFPWGKEHEADDPYNAKYFYSTLQRVRQGHHPGGDQDPDLRGGQVRGYAGGAGLQADAQRGGGALLPVPAHGQKDYSGSVDIL